jgi:hypothetical protein
MVLSSVEGRVMKRYGPLVLLSCDEIATEKANLVTQIADLERKLTLLKANRPKAAGNKKPLLKPPTSSRSAVRPLSFQHARIRVLPADDGKGRPEATQGWLKGELAPKEE